MSGASAAHAFARRAADGRELRGADERRIGRQCSGRALRVVLVFRAIGARRGIGVDPIGDRVEHLANRRPWRRKAARGAARSAVPAGVVEREVVEIEAPLRVLDAAFDRAVGERRGRQRKRPGLAQVVERAAARVVVA